MLVVIKFLRVQCMRRGGCPHLPTGFNPTYHSDLKLAGQTGRLSLRDSYRCARMLMICGYEFFRRFPKPAVFLPRMYQSSPHWILQNIENLRIKTLRRTQYMIE